LSVNAFDWWERNGQLAYNAGDVRIYNVESQDYLFVGQTLYASTTERPWYIHNIMNHARGHCLEIGLGLGCASKVILANKKVDHLLTIESNEHVIASFGKPLPRHNILWADANEWVRSIPEKFPMYDLIFVDHFTMSDDEEQILGLVSLGQELVDLLKSGGRMIFWVDENAPEEDQEIIRKLWITK
jgi:spermidine synthase